ncbi:MAG: hypothetical protein QUT30_15875 [Acidobacteriota bacterium]|nr:hypothetical protein [Acidobacteriota bacterium]
MRYPISILAIVLVSSVCSAQTQLSKPTGSVRYDKDGKFVTASFTFRVPLQPPVLGFMPERPYSAEEISQQTQILPDGSRVVRSSYSGYFYRDSAGRTRTEQRFPPSMILKRAAAPVVPEIFDPVAGCIYYLDQANKVAHRVELPKPIKALTPPQGLIFPVVSPVMMNAASGGGAEKAPERNTERLGTQVMDGITIQGTRTTTTFAAGTMGNDRPVSATSEIWVSPDLNVVIYSKIDDPRQGERIQMLSNISRAEPDAALFQVPSGYRVVDETGPFTITINKFPPAN